MDVIRWVRIALSRRALRGGQSTTSGEGTGRAIAEISTWQAFASFASQRGARLHGRLSLIVYRKAHLKVMATEIVKALGSAQLAMEPLNVTRSSIGRCPVLMLRAQGPQETPLFLTGDRHHKVRP